MEHLVYAQPIEALLVGALRGRLDAATQDELRVLGIDLSKPLLPAYPAKLWIEATWIVARRLYPQLSPSEAQWQLGAENILGLQNSILGRAQMAMAKVVGPRRALLRMGKTNSTNTNFVKTTVEEKGATQIEIVMAPYYSPPEFLIGSLHTLIDQLGGKDPRVTLQHYDQTTQTARFEAAWTL